jgi:hypothetical protein
MSMFWLWDRLTGDPQRIEAEMRDERVARDPKAEDDGAPPTLRCRVCAYEGPERFCPTCLADTMRAIPRRK